MKKSTRNILIGLLLLVITLGIWGIYKLIKMGRG